MDSKLGNVIKEKLGIPCIFSSGVMELARGIRNQLVGLIRCVNCGALDTHMFHAWYSGLSEQALTPMSLGLSHSLSRYKLKFSPDKVRVLMLLLFLPHPLLVTTTDTQVDTMIIQAIGLLDDLDKELNTYAMRVKEWYGWHFPEMAKIVADNLAYARVVRPVMPWLHALVIIEAIHRRSS